MNKIQHNQYRKEKKCKPLVTVLMSVYNEKTDYLYCAINSILLQSYKNFEFIIVDDGCDEYTKKKLMEISMSDNRIRIITNEKNMGLTKSLNKGISEASGKYIARMDSDDISMPKRIEKEIKYMEAHSEVAVVGSEVRGVHSNRKLRLMRYSNNPEIMRTRLIYCNPGVCHPTAMIRRSFLNQNRLTYDENYTKAQDYALWSDIIYKNGKIHKLSDKLVAYRIHPGQASIKNNKTQAGFARKIAFLNLHRYFDIILEKEEEDIFNDLSMWKFNGNVKANLNLISKIIDAPSKLDKRIVKRELVFLWWQRARHMRRMGIQFDQKSYFLNRFALSILNPCYFVHIVNYFVFYK